MKTSKKKNHDLYGHDRIRSEIIEISQGLHRIGAITNGELAETTMRMLGKDALPKIEPMPSRKIIALRAKEAVSQAVLAAYLNVTVSTVSQWERGQRHPSGAALKLLDVVSRHGLQVLA